MGEKRYRTVIWSFFCHWRRTLRALAAGRSPYNEGTEKLARARASSSAIHLESVEEAKCKLFINEIFESASPTTATHFQVEYSDSKQNLFGSVKVKLELPCAIWFAFNYETLPYVYLHTILQQHAL